MYLIRRRQSFVHFSNLGKDIQVAHGGNCRQPSDRIGPNGPQSVVRYVVTRYVPINRRLLSRSSEFDDNIPDLLGEAWIFDYPNVKIFFLCEPMPIFYPDNGKRLEVAQDPVDPT